MFSFLFGARYTKMVLLYFIKIEKIQDKKFNTILIIFYFALFAFLIGTIKFGGGGDERLAIMKLLRPLEGFIVLLAPVVLFKLLIIKKMIKVPLLILATAPLIAIGGKGAVLVFLLPITAAALTGHINLNKRNIFKIIIVLTLGIFLSIIVNYKGGSISEIINTLVNRIMMEGDIYILGLANNGISDVNIKSLLIYVFAPIFKTLMLPFDFDKNIGAQIYSALAGFEVQTGPNGHWPILAMVYGFKADIALLLYTLIFYIIVISIKLLVVSSFWVRKLPIAVLIPLVSYVIQFPQTFFADPPYQFVYFVHAVFVSLVLGLVFFFTSIKNIKG